MLSGIVILNKEEGITSQGAVNRVKRLFGADKAGHTGTLDPMATGVLPVLIGRGVKAAEFMITSDKHYAATLLLGVTTDTEDVTGEVLSRSEVIPSEDEVMAAIAKMKGESMQVPPMYSAIKIGGKKLCDLARDGKTVEREARAITVYDIKATKLSEREYLIDVSCSKGTYIRTLCADIGSALGCGGVMKTLKRLCASGFDISEAKTLSELEEMTDEERQSAVIPIERVFEKYAILRLNPFYERLARCGVEIYLKKLGLPLDIGTRVRLHGAEGFFALGEVREFEDGAAVKPIRQFDV